MSLKSICNMLYFQVILPFKWPAIAVVGSRLLVHGGARIRFIMLMYGFMIIGLGLYYHLNPNKILWVCFTRCIIEFVNVIPHRLALKSVAYSPFSPICQKHILKQILSNMAVKIKLSSKVNTCLWLLQYQLNKII